MKPNYVVEFGINTNFISYLRHFSLCDLTGLIIPFKKSKVISYLIDFLFFTYRRGYSTRNRNLNVVNIKNELKMRQLTSKISFLESKINR